MGVLGSYSNLADQGERLHNLTQIVPQQAPPNKTRIPKQVFRRLPAEEAKALVTAYNAGSTVYELAAQFRIHRNTVSHLLERASVPRRYNLISEDKLPGLIQNYEAGTSLAALSGKTGFAATTIRTAMKRAGVNLRPRSGWPRMSSTHRVDRDDSSP
ncbi:MAG: hypothetical protein ACRDZR_00640 [Acidimicrobiales bacterium]